MTFTRDEQLMRHALDDIFEDYQGEYVNPLSLGLAQAQEAGAAARSAKREFYRDNGEVYGGLARDLVQLILGRGYSYSDDEVYRHARMAGHFGNLALGD